MYFLYFLLDFHVIKVTFIENKCIAFSRLKKENVYMEVGGFFANTTLEYLLNIYERPQKVLNISKNVSRTRKKKI